MTNPDDPAFKTKSVNFDGSYRSCGLTKREYFAAMAMQGILAKNFPQGPSEDSLNSTVHYAIVMTDALIAELNKTPND